MPKNNELKRCGFPMKIRFGEKPKTEFVNNLDSIKVTLIDSPTMKQLFSYIPLFVEATWNDSPYDAENLTYEEKYEIISNCFEGKALPTALETIRFTFLIEGISLQEVTHILRTRTASFSADCSADKWWTNKRALVPNSIENSPEFYERYKKIVQECKELYVDIIDSKMCSIMDARYILPRCLETYYFMSIDAKNLIAFLHQRFDRQIQPETDNLIAYQMYDEVCKVLPVFNGVIDIDEVPRHWVATSRTGKCTNLYYPEENADIIEYNEEDFMYDKKRSEMNGTSNGSNKFKKYYDYYKDLFSKRKIGHY